MATLLIRNLEDDVRNKLRVRAAEHGRSMEEEARCILANAVETGEQDDPYDLPGSGASLVAELQAIFADLGGVDLPEFPDAPYKPSSIWNDVDENDT